MREKTMSTNRRVCLKFCSRFVSTKFTVYPRLHHLHSSQIKTKSTFHIEKVQKAPLKPLLVERSSVLESPEVTFVQVASANPIGVPAAL